MLFCQKRRFKIRKKQVCRRICVAERASMTLECAAVLPIFFIACITLILFMDAVKLQCTENLALSNKVRKLAVAAAMTGNSLDGKWLDIRKSKKYAYPVALPGIGNLRVALRSRVYPWIGSESGIGGGDSDGTDGSGQLVYVTDYESVYHTDPECTHIDLTIFKSSTAEIGNLRNQYGRRYKKCKGFPKNYSGPVYASATGKYYYPSADYGGLVRHVHVVRMGEHMNLPQCERCAAKQRKSGGETDDAAA